MAPHTPGPWRVERAKIKIDGEWDYAILSGDHTIVAEAFGRSGQTEFPPAEANAKLIAAAPELLEACEALLEKLEARLGDYEVDPDVIHTTRALIRKAKG